MPALDDPRHEAFARARAKGARLQDAYEDAGFAPGNRHAGRLAIRPEIAERIAELRAADADLDRAGPAAVIATLLKVTRKIDEVADPSLLRELRLTLLEAARLREAIDSERDRDRYSMKLEGLLKD